MKSTLLLLFSLAPLLTAGVPAAPPGWKLLWNEEFDTTNFIDPAKWSPCERGASDWNKHMTKDPRCYVVRNGLLQLRGFANDATGKDSSPFLTGGLQSKGKFEFQHGKIEIRARYKCAKGAWPALWMLGNSDAWPKNGEIDLMEHLNFDDIAYQTVHSGFTAHSSEKHGGTGPVKKNDFNTYGAEWDSDKVLFTINGKPGYLYRRDPAKGPEQWPFDRPFYLILSMQIGGKWVGPPDPKDYPAWLEIDWIRVYTKNPSKP